MSIPTNPVRQGPGRRQVLAAGSLAAVASALAGWWRAGPADAAPRAAPDGRPPMTGRAPVVFVGHGSPMNVLQDNDFTRSLRAWGRDLGLPRAVLVVSAHWLTEGDLRVSVAEHPQTVHDFGGFPPELQQWRYPAPGAPAMARSALARLGPMRTQAEARGLDHGAWTVLEHLYPAADVPVAQLSIDITRPGEFHLGVGRMLAELREQGVLIVGSGNVVHNLQRTRRGAPDSARGLEPWADDFDQRVRAALLADDRRALSDWEFLGPHAQDAVPWPDHYLPLLVALGAARPGEPARQVFEGFQAGTLSMRCVQWG